MVFGPHPAVFQPASPTAPTDLAAVARESGQQLVADLRRAEALSSGFRDDKLAYALLSCAMDRALARLAATACWGNENQLPSGEFWAVAGPLLDVSWLQHRARFKPRGYAGDYEMFERFWQRQCVDHPLGRHLDAYFQGQAAVEAVRARTAQIGAAIVERVLTSPADRPFHIVSVGCGPAIDLGRAMQTLTSGQRQSIRCTLLDLDQGALEHAQARLLAWLEPRQITATRENLYRLADKPGAASSLDAADVLVCSGLFDYLPDDAAQRMLHLFWRCLTADGLFLVGNFAPHNPTRAYMEWIGNWYLRYRTAQDLERLGLSAGIPRGHLSIGAERMGIDLFLLGERSSAARIG